MGGPRFQKMLIFEINSLLFSDRPIDVRLGPFPPVGAIKPSEPQPHLAVSVRGGWVGGCVRVWCMIIIFYFIAYLRCPATRLTSSTTGFLR